MRADLSASLAEAAKEAEIAIMQPEVANIPSVAKAAEGSDAELEIWLADARRRGNFMVAVFTIGNDGRVRADVQQRGFPISLMNETFHLYQQCVANLVDDKKKK